MNLVPQRDLEPCSAPRSPRTSIAPLSASVGARGSLCTGSGGALVAAAAGAAAGVGVVMACDDGPKGFEATAPVGTGLPLWA